MKNKVTVTIFGHDYTLVGGEEEDYIRKVAAFVDKQVDEVMGQGSLSQTDGVVLAAMNIADAYFREQQAAVALRQQIKDNADEMAKLKMELSESKREIFKLQSKR